MQAIKLEDYTTQPIVPIQYLIYKWLPKPGRIMLVGPPKNGKSFYALQMGLAVAQGTPLMGRDTTKGVVLYLQFDTPPPMWLERLQELKSANVSLEGQLYLNDPSSFRKGWDIRIDADRHEMRGIIDTVNPDVVIIDTLRKIHNAKENDSGEMKRISDLLTSLCQDRCLLIVHHTHKINKRDGRPSPADACRGSTALPADADMTILLYDGILSTEGRFDGEVITRYYQNDDTNFLIFPEIKDPAAMKAQLKELCKEFPNQAHNQLTTIAKRRFNLSRSNYYRIMQGAACVHSQQTSP